MQARTMLITPGPGVSEQECGTWYSQEYLEDVRLAEACKFLSDSDEFLRWAAEVRPNMYIRAALLVAYGAACVCIGVAVSIAVVGG